MIIESEYIRKLKKRDIFKEIRNKVTEIQDTSKKDKEAQEQLRQEEHDKIIDDIFGD